MATNREKPDKLLADMIPESRTALIENGSPSTNLEVANENEARSTEPSKKPFTERFVMDIQFRHKFLHTMVLCWSFVTYGWIVGMTGSTFPDLRQIIQENLATSTWLFTVGAFGFIVGSLGGGILFDRFNKEVLLAASLLGVAVFQLVTPYCTILPIMMGARFFVGVCCGALDTGSNADIYYVWGDDGGPYMQALHFAFSLGALLAPLATGPFLAKKTENCDTDVFSNTTTMQSPVSTVDTQYAVQVINNRTNNTESSLGSPCVEAFEDSNVHHAFMLSAVLCLTSAIGYICLLCTSKSRNIYSHVDKTTRGKVEEEQLNIDVNKKNIRSSQKIFFLILVCLQIASYCIIEDAFGSFLMTFCLAHLGWSKVKGSYATAVYWISFAIGRFLGIFITRMCKQDTLLTIYLLITAIGLVGFYIGAKFCVIPMVWVFIVILGVGMSILFPAFFSWTSQKIIPVKGKVSSLIFTSIVVIGMGFPVLIGNMMENFGALWFVHILLIAMGYCLVHYLFMRVLVRLVIERETPQGMSMTGARETELSLIK